MTRNSKTDAATEREAIELLLPWYMTGKLDADDRERVEKFLFDNPETGEQIALLDQEIAATIELNEAMGAPSPGSLNRLLEDLDRKFGRSEETSDSGWVRKSIDALRDAFELPMVRFAGIAAAIVIVVQAVAIGSLSTFETDRPAYQTASGEAGTTEPPGAQLVVMFAQDAPVSDVTTLLQEIDAVIIRGPVGDGLYELRLARQGATEEQLDELIGMLSEREDLIRFVSVAD